MKSVKFAELSKLPTMLATLAFRKDRIERQKQEFVFVRAKEVFDLVYQVLAGSEVDLIVGYTEFYVAHNGRDIVVDGNGTVDCDLEIEDLELCDLSNLIMSDALTRLQASFKNTNQQDDVLGVYKLNAHAHDGDILINLSLSDEMCLRAREALGMPLNEDLANYKRTKEQQAGMSAVSPRMQAFNDFPVAG